MTNTKQKITDEEVAEILEKLEPKDQCLYSCECCEWIGRDKDIGVVDGDRACCPECGSEIEEIKDSIYNLLTAIIRQQQDDLENAFDANRELRKNQQWTLFSESNPTRKGFYAVRYRAKGNKNARVFTARFRKGTWELFPKGYKPEYFFAWCPLPDASPLQNRANLKGGEE